MAPCLLPPPPSESPIRGRGSDADPQREQCLHNLETASGTSAKHEEGSVTHHLGIGLGIRRVQDPPQSSFVGT